MSEITADNYITHTHTHGSYASLNAMYAMICMLACQIDDNMNKDTSRWTNVGSS